MRLSSLLMNANPVRTPKELSPQGRADLRRIMGTPTTTRVTAAVPTPVILPQAGSPHQPPAVTRTPRPRSRRTLWLAPSLAAAVLVAGVTAFLGLSDRSPVTSYAFADTVTATVMPPEVAPIPLGTSLIFEVPYPEIPGQAQTYLVKRTWLSVDDVYWAGWTQIPSNLTFALQTVSDDIGYYRAVNWPYPKVFQMLIIGPDSSKCQGGDVPYADASFDQIMASTWFSLCAFVLSQASPGTYSPPAMDTLTMIQGGWSAPDGLGSTAVEIFGSTQDPDHLIDILEEFNLGMNGKWVSLPAEYEEWDQVGVPIGSCGGSLDYPFPYPGEDFAPGAYCAVAPGTTDTIAFDVLDNGTCVIQSGADLAPLVGLTLNPDGTCTYLP